MPNEKFNVFCYNKKEKEKTKQKNKTAPIYAVLFAFVLVLHHPDENYFSVMEVRSLSTVS